MMDANYNDFAKVLESALDKGQSENQITIHQLVDEIKTQLEPLIKKNHK